MTDLWTIKNGFNKSAIMRAAWIYYGAEIEHDIRRCDLGRAFAIANMTAATRRRHFATALRWAWADAKRAKGEGEAAAQSAQIIALIPRPERAARAETLIRQATCIEMLDRNGSTLANAAAMRSEAAQLVAA